ncbi:MAG: methyl-accepting chemotaxis protein [Maritimibacter sp.]
MTQVLDMPTDKPKRSMSIFVKLTVLIVAAAVLLTSAIAVIFSVSTKNVILKQTSETARQVNELVTTSLAGDIRYGGAEQIAARFDALINKENSSAVQGVALSVSGEVIQMSGTRPELEAALTLLGQRAIETEQTVLAEDGLSIATPAIFEKSGAIVGAVVTTWTADQQIALAMNTKRKVISGIAGIFVVAIFVTMWIMSRGITAPMVRLTQSIKDVADEHYDTNVPSVARGDEIGGIANAVEALRKKLLRGRELAQESRFRGLAFESSSAALMMVDRQLNIFALNSSVDKMLLRYEHEFQSMHSGFAAKDVLGKPMDFFHPGALKDRVNAILADPANLPYEANINVGEARFRLLINSVNGAQDTIEGYVVEWVDVTAEYLNNAILAAIESNQLKAEFSIEGAVLDANAHFCDLIKYSVEALRGQSSIDVFQFNSALADERGPVFDRLAKGETVYGRFDLKKSDGAIATIDGGFTPVMDVHGKLLRIVLIGNDVTDARRSLEEAAAQAKRVKDAQDHVVDALRSGLGSLAQGDLTARLDEAFSQDYEQLRVDFNSAVEGLLAAMRGVVENADLITGEAAEISSAADDLSQRTERQAATLEETASALDEMTSSVKSAAEGALHANEIVENARRNAEASGEIVREAVEAMSEIESSSTQISKITGVIDDIAFQTNLLALNAGVEAARAGEAGRGFAVVASEVRALAQRSSDAAREINELISASGAQVKRGVDLVDQAGGALKGIVESVSEISQNVSDIAVSSQEQSAGLAEINSAMNQLDQVTQQNAAMFEETTAASHALTREAETLAKTMAQFKTGTGTRPGTGTGAGKSAQIVDAASFASRREAAAPSPAKPTPPAPTAQSVASAPASATAQALDIEDDDGGWDEF